MREYRPSASKRWLACPGSLVFDAPEQPANKYAITGTAAHSLLEMTLIDGHGEVTNPPPSIAVLDDVTGVTTHEPVTDEMVDCVNMAVDYVYGVMDGHEMQTEIRLEHPTIEGFGGTIDVLLIRGTEAHILDLKAGTATVKADTEQMACYASLVLVNHPVIETITTHIMQPRSRVKTKFRHYEWSLQELQDFMSKVRGTVELVPTINLVNINENLQTGSHCYYCDARLLCPAKSMEQAARDFTDLSNEEK